MVDKPGVPRSWHELRKAGLVRLVVDDQWNPTGCSVARIVEAGHWDQQPARHYNWNDADVVMRIEGTLALGLALRDRYADGSKMWCFVNAELDMGGYRALSEIAASRASIRGCRFSYDERPLCVREALWAFELTNDSWLVFFSQLNEILNSLWLMIAALDATPSLDEIEAAHSRGFWSGGWRSLGIRAGALLQNHSEDGWLIAVDDEALFDDFGVEAGS